MPSSLDRPNPDQLLRRMQVDDAQAHRGRLKIFLGACAGVGKTFAMLAAARGAQGQGVSLVIGLVETHGRADTQAMAAGLPSLPLKQVTYRDKVLTEFDLEAALAFGASHERALVLVDELAHSNVNGSRHPKRWQDIEELLEAGIDVWSTMNVQHLESLNDVVSGITGIKVWETVPDRLFDEADEVVVVDLPPDELLARLKAGKVYRPEQAERAALSFFRKGNLLALRELALRRTADRVDGEVMAYRRRAAIQTVWAHRESLLACVGPGPGGEKVVRSCARLAAQLDVPWHAVHVETPRELQATERVQQHTLKVLKLAEQLGAVTTTLSAPDAAGALVRHARDNNLSRLVMGRHERHWPWQTSLPQRITKLADDLDVLQVSVPSSSAIRPHTSAQRSPPPRAWQGHAAAVGACVLTAALSTPLLSVLELSNIVMIFLLVVVGIALRFGRGPAVVAAFVGVGLFDFFFVPPRFSFAVSDVQYLVTFAVMLLVALVVGQLTAGLKVQARAATQREHRVRSLYDMSRDLAMALLPEQVADIGQRFLTAEFGAAATLMVADDAGRLQAIPGGTAAIDLGIAQWAFDKSTEAGLGTDTLPASACLVLPLKAVMRTRGVLIIEPPDARLLGPEQHRLLDTCASLLAISLERIHYIEVAQASTVQIESERLRNSLLSAISHDLRTPLASLIGLTEALGLTQPPPTRQQQDIAKAIGHAALRMSAMVNNLLDMARLEAGAVQLNRQWQPLEEVVGSALTACEPVLAGRPIQVHLADDLPLLHLDAVLMERVLVNLLENAAKYTPPGSPVDIAARAGEGQVTVTVDDFGPGLPPGREDAIFEKFERGAKESATPGVGLGLAICRAIVQAHGGDIRGESREGLGGPGGRGARFVIHLPIGHPPTDDGTQTVPASTEESQT
jgi:two-component system, OmpR family, sensor histidine kinase KdpD